MHGTVSEKQSTNRRTYMLLKSLIKALAVHHHHNDSQFALARLVVVGRLSLFLPARERERAH
jgi:hypothetical protein